MAPERTRSLARSVELDRKRRSGNTAILAGASTVLALLLTALLAVAGQRVGAGLTLASAIFNGATALWARRRGGDAPALAYVGFTLTATVAGVAATGNAGPGLWIFGSVVLVAAAILPWRWVVGVAAAAFVSFIATAALDRSRLPLDWSTASSIAIVLLLSASAVAILASMSWAGLIRSLAAEEDRAYEAESARTAADARYRIIADAASDLVAVVAEGGGWIFASPSHERVLGIPSADLTGHEPRQFVHPDDLARTTGLFLAALAEGSARGRLRLVRADGSSLQVETVMTAAVHEGRRVVVMVSRDVTEEAELFEKLRRSQLMEVMGQVAGGVAHDFNNLLSVIRSCAQFAKGSLPPGHEAHADIDDIHSAADRGAALTTQLLAVARRQVLTSGEADPAECVRDLARLLPRVLGTNIRITLEIDEGSGRVATAATLLEQILLNLAVNARDAMPSGGELRVGVAALEVGPGDRRGLAPGSYVAFRVRDTGTGMTDEVRARIFEPFYTTKGPGRGTGLGLVTCQAIATQAGGAIEVESAVGRGTTFTVLLPCLRRAPSVEGRRAARVGAATVLIVDDDPNVRALMVRVVGSMGHRITEAEDVTRALAQLDASGGVPDLVLTDVMLGAENGLDLAAEVRRRHPELPVILTSGYSHDPEAVRRLLGRGVTFIPKPFQPSELKAAVERALAG